jgi:oligoribonuclease (3'-5' exoribonuclease)
MRNMKATKPDRQTLNVDPAVHHLVKVRAAITDCQINKLVEALLLVGLKHEEEVMQLLEERTKMASQQETK